MIDLNDTRPFGLEPVRHDLDEIVGRLRESAEHWVPQHFPNGRRNGDEWRLANIGGNAPRKNGSCVIALKGPHAGDWIDFDTGEGGGPLSTLEHATGLTGRALFDYAAELAGTAPVRTAPIRTAAPAQAKDGAGSTPEAAPETRSKENARREIEIVIKGCRALADSPAETYLAARGLAVPDTPELRFHPDLTHWETRTGYPGLVAFVRNAGGRVVGIHRTYLAPDGAAKADLPSPRMMLGPVAGGTVRLAPPGGNAALGIAEGIETALSVMQSCPGLPVWAALAAGNLAHVALPPEVVRVVILADNDGEGAGIRAAERAAARHAAEGRRVWIAMPDRAGEDFNDLLQRAGPDAVRQALEAAVEWTPATTPEDAQPAMVEATASEVGGHRPVGFSAPDAPTTRMRADDGDLARLTARGWDLLKAANTPSWLYRCGGRPSWVERDDEGRPIAHAMTEDRMRHALAQLADWRRTSRSGDLVPAHPPAVLLKNLLATPDPALPVLAAIVTAPVFGHDGSLVTEPGYHAATRLLYEPPPGFVLPAVPERPSSAETDAARTLLLDGLLGDFPFTSEAERAHALALILLPFVRALIDGPTPLHLIEKPAPGTGATLMIDAIAVVTTGVSASVMVEGRDDEEWRKRLTAKLRQIPSIVLIDNLRRRLDAAPLAAALTAPWWEDRILGKSETVRFPIRCTWIATGNNPQFSNELARRLVRIRLDAHVDQPWRREDFRHANLLAWTRANRAALVAACLTLGRAWIAAGRPRHGSMLGSFEAWAGIMGGILEAAGVPGFLANLDEMYEAADAEGAVWRAFVAAWWERHGTAEVGTAELHELAIACEPPLPLGDGGERSQRTRLGRALGRLRDRVFAIGELRVCVRVAGTRQRAQRWRLTIENQGPDQRSPRSPGSHRENQTPDTRSPRSHPANQTLDARSPRSLYLGNTTGCTKANKVGCGGTGSLLENPTPDARSPRSPGRVNVCERSLPRSLEKAVLYQSASEHSELSERFSAPYARTDARARAHASARGRGPEKVHNVHHVHFGKQNQRLKGVNVRVNVLAHVHPLPNRPFRPVRGAAAPTGPPRVAPPNAQERVAAAFLEVPRRHPDHDNPDRRRSPWLT